MRMFARSGPGSVVAWVFGIFLGGFLVLLSPAPAAAQSHWGVTVSFVPQWNAVAELYPHLWDVADFEPDGNELRVGIVRGSDRGGDWSVMFVRNTIRTERVFDDTQVLDFVDPPVRVGSTYVVLEDPEIVGIKYEKFTPFVTIRDRVQIGLTYGAGIGAVRGRVEETVHDVEFGFDPNTFEQTVRSTETVMQREVKEFYALEFAPLGSVEVAFAVVIAPGLKARATGGFNFPNTHVFSFTINYLIGS